MTDITKFEELVLERCLCGKTPVLKSIGSMRRVECCCGERGGMRFTENYAKLEWGLHIMHKRLLINGDELSANNVIVEMLKIVSADRELEGIL